jgi:hypothetical protein
MSLPRVTTADEQRGMHEVVDRLVQKDPHRREYTKMGQTIAEMFIEKGRLEGEIKGEIKGMRAALLRQLRKRFKKVPRKVETRINATSNMQELETWLDNVLDAEKLADVGIPLD